MSEMKISIIAAMTPGSMVIGKDNKIPWRLPSELKKFKELTTGFPVIMGRNTYESIVSYIGKPLPNRTNVVITSNKGYEAPGCIVANSLEEAISLCKTMKKEKTLIIGGAKIYQQSMKMADELLISFILGAFDGDTRFPEIGPEWHLKSTELINKSPKDDCDYCFCTFERKRSS